ncbi:phage tail protein [Pseudomonas mosselii]|uniref:phage tail protein n=1 Tax=Pseudomonas mosselii TaxID=78327 RepID=UPI001E3AEFBC|nr:phage tail protein [Pseudomonas mosselii]WJR28904.1 phage tail protein [Pseudomonas mosselii]
MIDQNSQFMAILTNVGAAKLANANALGLPWKLTALGVGDANGTDPVPSATQTKLINERRRAPLNQLTIDPVNAAVIIAEQVIPADVGGWWIRELGLYDEDGDLVAVSNCAPSFKPVLSQGSGRTQIVRMNFIVSSTGNITLKIDPAVVLATRTYVDDSIAAVLPPTRNAGTYRKVTVDKRGVVISGSNPTTLSDYEIRAATTAEVVQGVDDSKPVTSLGVAAAIAHLVDSSPKALDTLKELADALGGDPHFSTTVLNSISRKADKATTLFGYGIPVATSAEVATGTDDDKPVTSLGVASVIKTLDPWAVQPIGVPIPVFDNMTSTIVPPNYGGKSYRYISLTASDSYNAGVLTSEVVSGSFPLVTATAVINSPGSALHGKTINLINTEQRVLRGALTAGELLQDAMQNITGESSTFPAGNTNPINSSGAFKTNGRGGVPTGISGGGAWGTTSVDFDASRVARTSVETRSKSIGVTYFMRVK